MRAQRETSWVWVAVILAALVMAGALYVVTLPVEPSFSMPREGDHCVPTCLTAYDR